MPSPQLVQGHLHRNGATIERLDGGLALFLRRQEDREVAVGHIRLDEMCSTVMASYPLIEDAAGSMVWASLGETFSSFAASDKAHRKHKTFQVDPNSWPDAIGLLEDFLSEGYGRRVSVSRTLLARDTFDAHPQDIVISPFMLSPDLDRILDAVTGRTLVSFPAGGEFVGHEIHANPYKDMREALVDASEIILEHGHLQESAACKRHMTWLAGRYYASSWESDRRPPMPLALLGANMEPLSPERCADILATQPMPARSSKDVCAL